MWILKNNNEYGVLASTRNEAIKKFKRDLGLEVKGRDIKKIW